MARATQLNHVSVACKERYPPRRRSSYGGSVRARKRSELTKLHVALSHRQGGYPYHSLRIYPETLRRFKSKLGEATGYSLKQRKYLEYYLLDGRLEINNTRTERSIKPFVIGRKYWLFSNTPKGADTSAVIYSLIETAKKNVLNPFQYLQFVFEQLPNVDIQDP